MHKLAMYAALAALALSPPAMADQGYMLSIVDSDSADTGRTATGILPGASLTTNDQEVQTDVAERVLCFTSDNELPAAEPAILGTIEETDTSPGADQSAVYTIDSRAIDRAGTFKGSVILKIGHSLPAGSAGNVNNDFWAENVNDQANKGAPAANRKI